MATLRDCGVRFIADPHHYEKEDGTRLEGITSTLIPAVFGDYTAALPPAAVQRAAARGTAVHAALARIDDGTDFATDYQETEYVRLRDAKGLTPVASEYIITDGRHFATAIDKVYEGDIIADIKTTADEHYPQWALQLSWEAAYYERINKRKVAAAYVFHLPKDGAANIITVHIVPARIITALTACYVAGKDIRPFASHFDMPLPAAVAKTWKSIRRVEMQYQRLQQQAAAAKAARDALTAALLPAMEAVGLKRWTYNGTTITRVDGTTRATFDSKALRAADPATYEKYLRQTTVAGSVRITIKDNDEQKTLNP